jgi:hypothetical protein
MWDGMATVEAEKVALYQTQLSLLHELVARLTMACEARKRKVERRDDGTKKRKKKGEADYELVRMSWGVDKRTEVFAVLAKQMGTLGTAEDAPGGGYVLRDARGVRELKVGGLHRALEERVYAQGVSHVGDDGPSTRETGKRVHRHVYHLVECLVHKRACTCGSRPTHFKTINKGAREVVRLVRAHGLKPMASEVLVLAPYWNLATRVDLLCLDADQRVVLVSIKTGAAKTKETAQTFRGGLSHIRDTEHARHQTQLAAERLALLRAGLDVHKALIVYAAPDGTPGRTVPLDARLKSTDGCKALDGLLRGDTADCVMVEC